ncbi:MAG TPA: hypothetical protein VGF67_33650 [Ktedonobacteraceae bacterium]|jgi:hypothetical protein
MLQKESSAPIYQQAQEYGRDEGSQPGHSCQRHEMAYQQHSSAESAGKVYPLPRDHTNILRFTLTVLALGLILLFGVLFVVGIGGTTGWASFTVACIALLLITGIGISSVK